MVLVLVAVSSWLICFAFGDARSGCRLVCVTDDWLLVRFWGYLILFGSVGRGFPAYLVGSAGKKVTEVSGLSAWLCWRWSRSAYFVVKLVGGEFRTASVVSSGRLRAYPAG